MSIITNYKSTIYYKKEKNNLILCLLLFYLKHVKAKFMKLNSSHIEFVFDCMKENTTKIRNIKQYLKAVLFNAPNTIDSYYTALVNHDMYGGY